MVCRLYSQVAKTRTDPPAVGVESLPAGQFIADGHYFRLHDGIILPASAFSRQQAVLHSLATTATLGDTWLLSPTNLCLMNIR